MKFFFWNGIETGVNGTLSWQINQIFVEDSKNDIV